MTNFDNLIPVYLCNDADRLAVAEDNVLYMHMLRAKLESDLSDMDMDFEDTESESVHTGRNLSRKERARRHHKANRTHKTRDRYHGKRGKEWRYIPYADRDMRLYSAGMNFNRNLRKEAMDAAVIRDAMNVSPVEVAEARIVSDFNIYGGCFLWDVKSLADLVYALAEDPAEQYILPVDCFAVKYSDRIDFVSEYREDGNNWYEYRTIKTF